MESISNVVNSDSKNLTEAAAIPTNPSDFMDYFDDKYNSSAGMWLAKKKIPELMKLVKNKTIKSVAQDLNKENKKEQVANTLSKWKEKGYKLFDHEVNVDSADYIFYK